MRKVGSFLREACEVPRLPTLGIILKGKHVALLTLFKYMESINLSSMFQVTPSSPSSIDHQILEEQEKLKHDRSSALGINLYS